MAKLRDVDLEKILGPDWRLHSGLAGPGHGRLQAQLNETRRVDQLNDWLFTAGGALTMGLGLLVSSLATQHGTAFIGWFGFAVALIVGSSVAIYLLKRKLRYGAAEKGHTMSSEHAKGASEVTPNTVVVPR